MIDTSVLGLEFRWLSRLPAPWRLRLAFSLDGQRVEVEAVSAFFDRKAWSVSELVYLLAAAKLGRLTPRRVAQAARARTGEVGRGDGRREPGIPSYSARETMVGALPPHTVDRAEIERGRGPRKRGEVSLTWDEVSGGLAGVVPELTEGTVGEALAAAGGELVGAWSGPEARVGGRDGEAEKGRRKPVRRVRKGKGGAAGEVPPMPEREGA